MGGFSDNIGPLVQAGVSMAGSLAAGSRQDDGAADAYAARQAALDAQHQSNERRRQDLLQAQLAAQRARLAAAGIGSSGGSADAILRGLTERSAADGAEAADAHARQGEALARSYDSRKSSRGGLDGMLASYGPSLLQSFGGGS